ncbi:MAG: sensor histidine kinase, partial [Coriobacteriia bacterium]
MAHRFLLVGLAPVLLLGLVSAVRVSDIRSESVTAANGLAAEVVRGKVEAFLEIPVGTLLPLNHLSPGENVPAIEVEHLQATVDNVSFVESVELVDRSGRVILAAVRSDTGASATDLLGNDRSQNQQFRVASGGEARAWSGVFTSAVTGNRSLNLAVPVTLGVAMATVEIESLSRAVQDLSVAENADVVILDSRGTVLFDSRREVAEQRPSWRNLEPVAAALEGRTGDFRYDREGTEIMGSTSVVPETGWIVLVEQPWSQAYRPVVRAWWNTAGLAAVAALAAVAVGLTAARNLSRPIRDIGVVAEQIQAGDYSVRPGHYQYHEVNRLAESINDMADAVATRERDLAEAIKRLKVAVQSVGSMSAELAVTEERERRRLAEELHDRVSQSLAAATLRISLASETCETNADLEVAKELLRAAIHESRVITNELAAPELFELGLAAALEAHAESFAAQNALEVTVDAALDETGMLDEVKSVLLRAARELLVNVVKHASASCVSISLFEEDDYFVLRVSDDGAGAPQRGEAQ